MKVIIDSILLFVNQSPRKMVNIMYISIIIAGGYLYYAEKTDRLLDKQYFELEKKAYVSRILLLNARIDSCNTRHISAMVICDQEIKEINELRISELKDYKNDVKVYKENFDKLYQIITKERR